MPAACEFCLANSLDPDQDVMPDLGPSCLTPWCYALKIILIKIKVKLKKISADTNIYQHAKSYSFEVLDNVTIVIVCVHRGNQ